ncbi:MAG TPA: Hsp20/alpha crystallin family protein [Syntrophales bacterium]|nr:Hsp20/alpha crystallin family protein [Syntrophales bacterium]
MAKAEERKDMKETKQAAPPIPFIEEQWYEDLFKRPLALFNHPPGWPNWKSSELAEMSFTADIFEDGNDVVVKADMPGVKKEDIDVSLSEDVITIKGERKKEEKVDRKDYYHLERSYGSFSRSFRLPAEVQADKAEAKFDQGVLELRIPRVEQAQAKTKKVTIK